MGILVFLIVLAVSGLIIGALARLALPGPDPMSIPATIGLGLGGSFLGGIVARVLLGTGRRTDLRGARRDPDPLPVPPFRAAPAANRPGRAHARPRGTSARAVSAQSPPRQMYVCTASVRSPGS